MPSFHRIVRASAPLVVVVLAQAALAQTRPAGNEEMRDPEVQLPAPPVAGAPCVVTPAVAEDARLNRDILRVMQTNPCHSQNNPQPDQRWAFVVTGSTFTGSIEESYTSAGCGFYLYRRLYTFKNTNGKYTEIHHDIALSGFNDERLFYEGVIDTFAANLSPAKKKGWSQMTSLEVTGSMLPVEIGNRYTVRVKRNFSNGFNDTYSGAGYTFTNQCEVTERRPATEFNPRLSGNAFVTVCQNETLKNRKRDFSTVKSIAFADINQRFSFDMAKCRLEWRSARDFNRNLRGDAFIARCTGAEVNNVFLPELGVWLPVDSIDGTFKSKQTTRSLLTEVGPPR